MDDSEIKIYYHAPIQHVGGESEFCPSYTTVEGEGDKGGEVDNNPFSYAKIGKQNSF